MQPTPENSGVGFKYLKQEQLLLNREAFLLKNHMGFLCSFMLLSRGCERSLSQIAKCI